MQFDAQGLPTAESYRELAKEAAEVEGQDPDTVGFEYFKTSDAETAAVESWMTYMEQLSKAGELPDYEFNGANCALFCIAGLQTGNVVKPNARLSIVPNRLWEPLLNLSDGDWENNHLHEHVRHTIHYCGSTPCLPQ